MAAVAGRLRLAAAICAGKLAGSAARRAGRGGGTSLPGLVARRVDAGILRKVMGASAACKIVVTGSNGKTTTCRMIAALAERADRHVVQNRTGSNLIQGVTAVAVNGADLLGRMRVDALVLEVDEATVRHVAADIAPNIAIITNLFRDQLDRFGELYSVADALGAMVQDLSPGSVVILNGDDPLVADLGTNARASRLYFGVTADQVGEDTPEHAADTVRCIRCQHYLHYDRAYLSHLGAFSCPRCGYSRPPLDFAVTGITPNAEGGGEVRMETPFGPLTFSLPLPGLHNAYNAAAAVAAGYAMGLDPPASTAFSTLRPAFGRVERIRAGDRQVVLSFVKNPISYNATLRAIMQDAGDMPVLAVHSNTPVDGEDFSWLWDVDLEAMAPRVTTLVASGSKAEEVAMRYKYARVPEDRIRTIPDIGTALDSALEATCPGQTLYILAGYTPTREIRRIMQRRGWVSAFWKE